jgi:2-methylcitrate dehydratase PrpD
MTEPVDMSIASSLGTWASELSLSQVPEDTRHIARRCIIDTIAVMIAGSHMPVAMKIADHVVHEHRDGECSILGSDKLTTATGAALANGTAGHILDFDDTSYAGIVHGSSIILPALLAASEQSNSNGSDLLEAFIAASEITYAIGLALSDSHYMAGWWATGTLGAMGGAAGAGKLLGHTAQELSTAIAFAVIQSTGMGAILGYNAKPVLAGQAARRGLESALMSAQGHTAPDDIFEHGRGFLQLMNDGQWDASELSELGDVWRLTDPGVAIKIAPVCSAAQAAIGVVEKLIADNNLDPENIAHVRCDVSHLVYISLIHNRPTVAPEAQFSMPFAVGCMLVFGKLAPEQILDETLENKALRDAMAKVEMVEDEDLNGPEFQPHFPECARVTITMENGDEFAEFRGAATGMPSNPMFDDQLSVKFKTCTSFAGWSDDRADVLLEKLWDIENAGPLRAILRGGA